MVEMNSEHFLACVFIVSMVIGLFLDNGSTRRHGREIHKTLPQNEGDAKPHHVMPPPPAAIDSHRVN